MSRSDLGISSQTSPTSIQIRRVFGSLQQNWHLAALLTAFQPFGFLEESSVPFCSFDNHRLVLEIGSSCGPGM
jgi:hypothetical protein